MECVGNAIELTPTSAHKVQLNSHTSTLKGGQLTYTPTGTSNNIAAYRTRQNYSSHNSTRHRCTVKHCECACRSKASMLHSPHALPRQGLQLSRCAMQAVGVQGPGEIRAGARLPKPPAPPERDLADGLGRARPARQTRVAERSTTIFGWLGARAGFKSAVDLKICSTCRIGLDMT